MAYRKLGRDNKHRRSMLATLTKQVINEEMDTFLFNILFLVFFLNLFRILSIHRSQSIPIFPTSKIINSYNNI